MPAEINNSVINVAALTPRSTPEAAADLRSRNTEGQSNTSNPQAVLAGGNDQVVRAPDPDTGGQGVENRQSSNPGDRQDSGNAQEGVGDNVDVTI